MNTFRKKNRKKNIELEKINFQEIFQPYFSKWYFFIFSLIFFFTAIFLYLKYQIPVYKNVASILISEEKGHASQQDFSMLENLNIVHSSSNLANEVEKIKSYSVLQPVVDSLNLQTTSYLIGDKSGIRRTELFEKSPLNVQLIDSLVSKDFKSESFEIIITDLNRIKLIKKNNSIIDINLYENTKIKSNFCSYKINKTNELSPKWIGKKIEIILISKQIAIDKLSTDLNVSIKDKESSIILLSINGTNSSHNNLILDCVIDSYKTDALNDKNIVKKSTSNFIKDRIKFLVDELNEVEKSGENYKTNKGITDYQVDVNSFISTKDFVNKNLNDVSVQLGLTNLLLDFLKSNTSNEELLPSNIGLEDVTINQLSEQFNKLVLDKRKFLQSSKTNNPIVSKIDSQLELIKESILKSLFNLKKIHELKLKSLNDEFRKVNSNLSTLPLFEREYRSILRQQQIKESLYLYLLQKREENEIELAASVINLKIIIPPVGPGKLVSPVKNVLFLVAFLLSIFTPIGIIYILQLFDNKLKGAKDLGDLTLLGQIPQSDKANSLIDDTDRSFLSEAFRMLRTNLNFSLSDKSGCKVIALSSSLPGEGKTFISMNLANTLSKTGSRVVVIGLDLRMPKLLDYVTLNKTKGVSNYIIDETLSPTDIINSVSEKNELYLVNAGDIPPNPAELLLKPRFKELLNYLKANFDYVIIDTSPIGLISDCLPIVKNEADLLLYVARVGYLQKKMLGIPKSFIEDGIVENLAIVLNYTDPLETKYGSGYGYGYGYGYGGYVNGYFEEKQKTTWITKIIGFFKKK